MQWSKLKKTLEDLFDPDLDLKIFCTVQRGERDSIGRYWFVLGKKTIWDEPKNVSHSLIENVSDRSATDMGLILRRYIEIPKDELLSIEFPEDRWGISQVLKSADRRIGKRRLVKLKESELHPAAEEIIQLRLGTSL